MASTYCFKPVGSPPGKDYPNAKAISDEMGLLYQ
jgi:hypothetical protein